MDNSTRIFKWRQGQRSVRSILQIVTLFLFFLQGLLFYFFPEDYYTVESPLRWIKYLLLIFFSFLSFPDIRKTDFMIFISLAAAGLLLMNFSHSESLPAIASRLTTYIAPLTIVFLAPAIQKLQLGSKGIRLMLILAIISGFVEFFLLRGIFSGLYFEEEGYVRVATIFFSPNSAGLMLFLLLLYGLSYNFRKNFVLNIFLLLLSFPVILFTGSRTVIILLALFIVLFSIQILLRRLNTFKLHELAAIVLLAAGLAGGLYLLIVHPPSIPGSEKMRNLKIDTLTERMEQIMMFMSNISADPISPGYDSFIFTYDNAYLQYWSDFSLLGFALFMIFIGFRISKVKKIDKVAAIALLVAGLSINIFYIWPITYIFYYLLLKKPVFSSNFYE